MTLRDGRTLYSKPAAADAADAPAHFGPRTSTASLLAPPAAPAWVYTSGDGTSRFVFQTPWVLAAGAAGAARRNASAPSLVLTLAYNPDGAVRGGTMAGGGALNDPGTPDLGLDWVLLNMLPVPHGAAETVSRESYDVTSPYALYDGGTYGLRLDLYYVTQDEPARRVYAAALVSTQGSQNASVAPAVAPITAIIAEAGADGAVSFAFGDQVLLDGFVRRREVGARTPCRLYSRTWRSQQGPGAPGGVLTPTSATLVAVVRVE